MISIYVSLCMYSYICTEPSGPWSPLPSCTARVGHCRPRQELHNLGTSVHFHLSGKCWKALAWCCEEVPRQAALGEPSGCNWGFSPHMPLPACCPLSSKTLLLWCNIMVKEHNRSLSASVACWGHAYFQAPHIMSLEAKQAGMERVHSRLSPSRNSVLLVLFLALLALLVIRILEHQCVLLAVRGPGKQVTHHAE